MKNWRTTTAFGIVAALRFIATQFPAQAAWANPAAELALFVAGLAAKDAGVTGGGL